MGDIDRIVKAIHSAYTLGLLSTEAQLRIKIFTGMSPYQAEMSKAAFCAQLTDKLSKESVNFLQSISRSSETL